MDAFSTFLNEISSKPLFVLDKTISRSKYVPIDLSSTNTMLNQFDVSFSSSLANFINQQIEKQSGIIGYGGYNETRNIYQRSTHFKNSDIDNERNIHLGIDLWSIEGTPVYAPLNGTVHSFKNNTNFGDYGPTIILKHQLKDKVFYTLYGHLSLDSIDNLKENQLFSKGQKLGSLGHNAVNGDYPPHLHFQIIKDIQDYRGDYPGVCNKKNLAFFLDNCPNPNLILKI